MVPLLVENCHWEGGDTSQDYTGHPGKGLHYVRELIAGKKQKNDISMIKINNNQLEETNFVTNTSKHLAATITEPDMASLKIEINKIRWSKIA